MLVQRIQSTNLPKSMIKKVAPKAENLAKKLSQVCFNDAKVTIPQIEKAMNIKIYAGDGGSVCVDIYSVEAPDAYSC